VSVASDDDTNSTKSDGQYDAEHDSDVDMCMEDEVNAPDGVDLDGNLVMDKDSDDEEEEDEEDEDRDGEDEEEEEDEEEDEDAGKEPQTISQGEMVNRSADDVDTMVDNQPIVLPEQGQDMRELTPRPQPPGPASRLKTPEPHPQPRMSKNLARQCQLREMLRQPETLWMWMWISSSSANQQGVTVSSIFLSPMSVTPESLSLRDPQMDLWVRSEPVFELLWRRWLLRSG